MQRLRGLIARTEFRHPLLLSGLMTKARTNGSVAGNAPRLAMAFLYGEFRCLEVLGKSGALLPLLTDAMTVARANGWGPEVAMLLCAIGRIRFTHGDYRDAANLWARAIDTSKLSGSRDTEIEARIGLGQVYDAMGDRQTAARLQADASVLAMKLGDNYLISKVAINQGYDHRMMGDLGGAQSHFERALHFATRGQVRHYIAESHWQMAAMYLELGDMALAQWHNEQAYQRAESAGYGWLICGVTRIQADILRCKGLNQSAALTYAKALELAVQTGARRQQADCHDVLSVMTEEAGDSRAALWHCRESQKLQAAIVRQLNVSEHLDVLRQYDLSERTPLELLLTLSSDPVIQGASKLEGLQRLCDTGVRVLQANGVSVWERNDSGMQPVAQAHGEAQPALPMAGSFLIYFSALRKDLEDLAEPRVVDDVRMHPRYPELLEKGYTDLFKSSIEVPLRQRGEFRGVLLITRALDHTPWSRDDVLFSSHLGALASQQLAVSQIQSMADQLLRSNAMLEQRVAERTEQLAIANVALTDANQALRDASQTDALTGLHNRRYFLQTIESDVQLAARHWPAAEYGLVFYLVDIDHFKEVNDNYGHDAGDQILVQVATRINLSARKSSHVVRWGGEEFLVISRNVQSNSAHRQAERICQAMRGAPFALNSGVSLHVTCSVGYASYPMERHGGLLSWNEVLDLADQALYQVKGSGRNGWMGVIPEAEILLPRGSMRLDSLLQAGLIKPLRSP